MYFSNPPQQIWTILMMAVSLAAFVYGGRPERMMSVANVVAWAVTPMMYRTNIIDPQWGMMAVDVLFMIGLIYLAMTTNRTWLLFAAAFQLMNVITHLAMAIDPGVRAGAYLRGLVIWSYLVLASLAVAAWQCWRVRSPRSRPT